MFNLQLPTNWAELSDKMLRMVYGLFARLFPHFYAPVGATDGNQLGGDLFAQLRDTTNALMGPRIWCEQMTNVINA